MGDTEVEKLIRKAISSNERDDDVFEELLKFQTVDLCKGMKEYLCDPQKVSKAMELLVTITSRSPRLSAELFFVLQFVCNINREAPLLSVRYMHPLIEEVKKKMILCDAKTFALLFERIVEKADLKKLNTEQRRKFFDVLDFILCEENIRTCSELHFNCFILLFDSERSPDLVLTCFKLVSRLCRFGEKKVLVSVTSSFFSFIAAYFPIVFSQPPGSKVSKKDLQDALLECLQDPSFTEFCLPFLLGKIVSPSLSIKCEVLRALNCCVANAEHISVMQMKEIVNVVKNEALVLLNNRESLSAFLVGSSEVLGAVAQKCSSLSGEDIISVFDVLVEEKSPEGSMYERTQLNATFFFHVLTSSWNCCVELGVYCISTVIGLSLSGLSTHDFIILSAVLTSIVDKIVQEKPDLVRLEEKLERIRPLVVDTACSVAEKLLVDSSDDFERLCKAEFSTSFLKFQYFLGGWNVESELQRILEALIQTSLQHDKVYHRINKLLCQYVSLDWNSCKAVVERYARNGVTVDKIPLLTALGCSCGEAAAVIISNVLSNLNDVCDESANIHIVDTILSGIHDLNVDDAKVILEVLQRIDEKTVGTERMLMFFTTFFSKAPAELCDTVSSRLGELPTVEAVALLSIEKVVKAPIPKASLMLLSESFVKQLPHSPMVAQNGLIGCFLHLFPQERDNHEEEGHEVFEETWGQSRNANISLCLLWAVLLLGHQKRLPSTTTTSSLAKKHLTILFQEQQQEKEIFEKAMDFVPVASYATASVTGKGNSHLPSTLLPLVVEYAPLVRQCLSNGTVFWRVLERLLLKEREAVVCHCGPSIMQLLEQWLASHPTTQPQEGQEEEQEQGEGGNGAVNILPVVLTLHRVCEGRSSSAAVPPFIVLPIVATDTEQGGGCSVLADALFKGLTSPSLHTRCAVLRILLDVGEFVSTKGEHQARTKMDVERSGLKAKVLCHTLTSLSDPKRKVRQAAARCRHVWFLVK